MKRARARALSSLERLFSVTRTSAQRSVYTSDAPTQRLSQFVRHAHRHAAALFHALDLPVTERRLQVRTVELHRQRGEAMRPAESARLKRLLLLLDVSRDVERVTLAVAESVDDRPALTALLTDRLPQRLRLTPVTLQVLSLGHHQSLLTGREHLLFASAAV